MIEKIKTVTWEVRSHGFLTEFDENGTINSLGWRIGEGTERDHKSKGEIKKYIMHLQDVLKCMKQIEKEKEKQVREEQVNEDKKGTQDERN